MEQGILGTVPKREASRVIMRNGDAKPEKFRSRAAVAMRWPSTSFCAESKISVEFSNTFFPSKLCPVLLYSGIRVAPLFARTIVSQDNSSASFDCFIVQLSYFPHRLFPRFSEGNATSVARAELSTIIVPKFLYWIEILLNIFINFNYSYFYLNFLFLFYLNFSIKLKFSLLFLSTIIIPEFWYWIEILARLKLW